MYTENGMRENTISSIQGEQPPKRINAQFILVGLAVLVVVAVSLLFFLTAKKDYSKVSVEIASFNNSGDYAGAQRLLEEKIKSDSAPELKLMLANSYLDEGSVRGQEAEASRKAQNVLIPLESSHRSVYFYDLLGYSYEIVNN